MASLDGSNQGTPEIKRRRCLSLQDKLKLLRELDEGEGRKTNLAHKFGISKSTLSSIIATRSKIENAFRMAKFSPNRKRLRMGKYSILEDQLSTWCKKELESGRIVADEVLEKKAKDLARLMQLDDFCASQGWLNRFKERKGIADWAKSFSDILLKQKHSYNLPVRTSSKYSDASAAEADNCLAEFMSWTDSTNWTDAVLPDLLRTYSLANIYSVTETGLYFKCLPFGMNFLRGQSCARGELASERLTVVTAANLDGSRKLPLFCVGKERNPRCFKGVRHFPVSYRCSHNAWMTPEFFCHWIQELDTIFTKEGKKVAILVDTSPAHVQPPFLQSVDLIFLPPHTSRNMQSQNKGIVYFLKWKYRELILKRMILHFETSASPKPFVWNVLDALHDLRRAWDRLSPSVVHKCFTETGFSMPNSDGATSEVTPVQAEQLQNYRSLYQRVSLHIPVDMSMDDYISVDRRLVTWDQMGMVSKIISNTFYNPGFINSHQNGVVADDAAASHDELSPEAMETSLTVPALSAISSDLVSSEQSLLKIPNGTAFNASSPDLAISSHSPLLENGTNCNDSLQDSDIHSCEQTSPETPNCVSLRTSTSTSPFLSSSATPMQENGSNCNTSLTCNGSNSSFLHSSILDSRVCKTEPMDRDSLRHRLPLASGASGPTTGCATKDSGNPRQLDRRPGCTITMEVKEPEEALSPPSLRQAHDSLLLLRKYVELTATSASEAVEMFGCLNQLEDFIEKQAIIAPRQTSMLDFFNRL